MSKKPVNLTINDQVLKLARLVMEKRGFTSLSVFVEELIRHEHERRCGKGPDIGSHMIHEALVEYLTRSEAEQRPATQGSTEETKPGKAAPGKATQHVRERSKLN